MTQPYRLHDSVLYQMTLTSRIQERRLDEGLKALGLSRITWCVLLAVHNERLSQPSAIAEFIGVDRTATSRALRHMEAAGWLARHGGLPDKRTTQVELTAQGIALLDAATPLALENHTHFLSKLTPQETEALSRIMEQMRTGEDGGLVRF